jgi:opacity protein-like surface antigen
MYRPSVLALLAIAGLLISATPTRADVTAFIGSSRLTKAPVAVTDDSDKDFRFNKGFAIGLSLVIVGFEFEWSNSAGDDSTCGGTPFRNYCSPSLTTGMANVLLQTPHGIMPVQVYGTVGAGFYREHYDLDVYDLPDENDYGVGTNVGGGVKIDVVGPLRLRLDYRVFKLANDAFHATPQRFYAGANLAF